MKAQLLQYGSFFWQAGMFLFKVVVVDVGQFVSWKSPVPRTDSLILFRMAVIFHDGQKRARADAKTARLESFRRPGLGPSAPDAEK
jgi:hypothetical protein